MSESPGHQAEMLPFVWDNDAEQWVALVGLGGPAATCLLEVDEITLEFDRLLPGRLTRAFMGPELSEDGRRLCGELLGGAPPKPENSDHWRAPVDQHVARALWAVARLLADRGPAERQALTGHAPAFVHVIELAVAAARAKTVLPSALVADFCDPFDIEMAADRLAGHLRNHTWPALLLEGLKALWCELRRVGAISKEQFEMNLGVALNICDVKPNLEVLYRDVSDQLLEVNRSDDHVTLRMCSRIESPLLVTARLDQTVIGWIAVAGDVDEVVELNTSFSCMPDSLSISAPPIFESISSAIRGAEKALYSEARCDINAANAWAYTAEKWFAGRSRRRAAEAYRRAAMLANGPSERARFGALAECVENRGTEFCGLGMFWLAWWSAPEKSEFSESKTRQESARVNPSGVVVSAVMAN